MSVHANYLQQQYAYLDDCPPELLGDVIRSSLGTLSQRVEMVSGWHANLLAGQFPDMPPWIDSAIIQPLWQQLTDLRMLRHLKGQSEYVVALIRDMLRNLHLNDEAYQQALLEELAQLHAKRISEQEHPQGLSEEEMNWLRKQAVQAVCQRGYLAQHFIYQQWVQRAAEWQQLAEVFDDLGMLMGVGQDLTRGILKHAGWQEVQRMQKLLEKLDEFKKIIQSLGRLQDNQHDEQEIDSIFEAMTRLEEELTQQCVPHLPHEMHGIERTGNVARMWPLEAVFLGHSTMRYLWHARRAEQALLSYQVQGTEITRQKVEVEYQQETQRARPRPERGPILAVVDTSGSMSGMPERVAKALVLQALKTAHLEKRRCYLYAFGGQGQIIEHELSIDHTGVNNLLEFMSYSFGGGNDIDTIEHAVKRLEQENWKKADMLIVSDGEWHASSHIQQIVEKSRKAGTRFHGVQVGNQGKSGMHQICNPVHHFDQWLDMLR